MSKFLALAAAALLLAAPLSAQAAGKAHMMHHHHQKMMMVQGKMRPIFAMVNGHMVPVYESGSANGM